MATKIREPRMPFLVTWGESGGECKDILDAVKRDDAFAIEAQATYARAHGCSKYYGQPKLVGLHCEGPIPDGWMHRKKDPAGMIIPKTKALKDEMKAVAKRIDHWELGKRIGCQILPDGDKIYWPYFETVGGYLILWIPTVALEDGYIPPGGAIAMKISDYWMLVEREVNRGDQ